MNVLCYVARRGKREKSKTKSRACKRAGVKPDLFRVLSYRTSVANGGVCYAKPLAIAG